MRIYSKSITGKNSYFGKTCAFVKPWLSRNLKLGRPLINN